jgi:hypothetical protein
VFSSFLKACFQLDKRLNQMEGSYENGFATGIHTVKYANGSTGTVRAELTSDRTGWTWVNI